MGAERLKKGYQWLARISNRFLVVNEWAEEKEKNCCTVKKVMLGSFIFKVSFFDRNCYNEYFNRV